MKRQTAVFFTMWRPDASLVASHIPVLVAVSSVVAFFVVLPAKEAIDGIAFHTRASYGSYVEVAPGPQLPAGVTVWKLQGLPVVPDREVKENIAFTPSLQNVEVHVVGDLHTYLEKVLGSNLISSQAKSGAIIDEDIALKMRLRQGDSIALLTFGLPDRQEPAIRVKVTGVARPYPSPEVSSRSGLVVVSRSVLPSWFLNLDERPFSSKSLSSSWVVFLENSQTGGSSRVSHTKGAVRGIFIDRLLRDQAGVGFAGAIVFGILLWASVSARLWGQILRRHRRRAALLQVLGTYTEEVARVSITGQAIIHFIVLTLSFWLVKKLGFEVLLRTSLQIAATGPVFLILGAILLVQYARAVRRAPELFSAEKAIGRLAKAQ